MNPIELSLADLAIAAGLVLASAALSFALKLGAGRSLVIAAARMIVQLAIVGLVLRHVLASQSIALTSAILALMVAAAVREVAVRPTRRLRMPRQLAVSGIAVTVSSIGTAVLALATAIRPEPWHDARYAIPLVGILLGSVLNSASLGLDGFLSGVVDARAAIEARLALGSTFRLATADLARRSIRRGMIPLVNQMSAAGIITLPGIMTGQVLAGMDPVEAVKYQILLLLLLSGASVFAVVIAVELARRSLGDDRDRLRLDRLHLG